MNTPLFNFRGAPVRAAFSEEFGPGVVVSDVCHVLGLSNIGQALKGIDSRDLTSLLVMSGGQLRRMKVCNESGLYALVFKSRKPQAQEFRRWVTSEVLPALRQTGTYTVPGAAAGPADNEFHALLRHTAACLQEAAAGLPRLEDLYEAKVRENVALHSHLTGSLASFRAKLSAMRVEIHTKAQPPAAPAAPAPRAAWQPATELDAAALSVLASAVRALRVPPGGYESLPLAQVLPLALSAGHARDQLFVLGWCMPDGTQQRGHLTSLGYHLRRVCRQPVPVDGAVHHITPRRSARLSQFIVRAAA